MFLPFLATLAFAQASPLAIVPPSMEEDQLRACLIDARTDPASAITSASAWLEGLSGASVSAPQQCLGFAYIGLLRWEAATTAFVTARDARLVDDRLARARLGAMAGNAALAGGNGEQALALLQQAGGDAAAVGDGALGGAIAADRARALVGLGRDLEGAQALASARELAPQDAGVWLLSATLARRMEDLESARGWIAIAALLDPQNPAVGLEAGVIAVLGGSDEVARTSFQTVIDLAPRSPQAEAARTYLAQLAEEATAQ